MKLASQLKLAKKLGYKWHTVQRVGFTSWGILVRLPNSNQKVVLKKSNTKSHLLECLVRVKWTYMRSTIKVLPGGKSWWPDRIKVTSKASLTLIKGEAA